MRKVMVKPPRASQKLAAYYKKLRPTLPKSRQAMTATGVREMNKTAAGKLRDAELIDNWFSRHEGVMIRAQLAGKTPEDSKAMGQLYGWGGWEMWEAAQKALRKARRARARGK